MSADGVPSYHSRETTVRPSHPVSAARGVALFVGTFSLVNLVGERLFGRFDANLWWIDTRTTPHAVTDPLVAVAAVCLLSFGLRPRMSRRRQTATALATVLLLVIVVLNIAEYYAVIGNGLVHGALAVPLSLATAIVLTFLLVVVTRPTRPDGSHAMTLAATTACAVLFPLMQMFFFGSSDYRRSADAIVVFGALTAADGTPSWVLADRVRTACDLYHQGYGQTLVMSGGPGEGRVHETEAMRDLAIELGVPASDIVLDRDGLSTAATARNVSSLMRTRPLRRMLAVSNAYHLPRIKMAFQQCGVEVYTVPARETYRASIHPYNIARELAAIWIYYLGLA
jgi:uncharacterized SAM-binding protein YcdF (DUF218 family)